MKTKIAVDTCLYFAKATWPVGNNWKSPWTQTQAGADAYAKWFCRTWGTVGVRAKAAVFYRDGTLTIEHTNDIPA